MTCYFCIQSSMTVKITSYYINLKIIKGDNVLQKVWESMEIVKHDKPFGLKADIFIPS